MCSSCSFGWKLGAGVWWGAWGFLVSDGGMFISMEAKGLEWMGRSFMRFLNKLRRGKLAHNILFIATDGFDCSGNADDCHLILVEFQNPIFSYVLIFISLNST